MKAKVFSNKSNNPAHLASTGSFFEDLSITYISRASSEGGADTGAMSSLKMLKLARLGRILGHTRPPWPRAMGVWERMAPEGPEAGFPLHGRFDSKRCFKTCQTVSDSYPGLGFRNIMNIK